MNTKYEGLRINIPHTTQKTQSKKAFTLVELIIVITILAILATIAFISFKNYAGDARDSNKLTTLSNIEKGLSLYQLKTGTYPIPDTPYGSGNYSGALISQVGYIGTGVSQAISMNKVPKDPTVDFEYTYGLSNNKKYYQVGTVLESSQTSFIPQTYANNYTSKVVGNYKGLYRFGTGGENYISNIPSLIFTHSGGVDFGDTNLENPKFVINNGGNLVKPYHENNNESIDTTLLKLTGTGVSLTGAVIPTTFEDWNTQSGTLKDSLGYSEDTIGHKIYGDDYNSENKNLQTPQTSGGGNINGTFTLVANSIIVGELTDITNNCTIAPTSYTSSNEGVATISGTTITTLSVGTTTIVPVGGACGDNVGKGLTVTAPICTSFTYNAWGICKSNSTQTRTITSQTPSLCTGGSPILEQSCTYVQWKDIADSHCDNDDYEFTYEGTTYRWAGCNSILGNGVEWGKKDDGANETIRDCFGYNGLTISNTNCPIATSGNAMYSTAKEKNWNQASSVNGTVNNIWGKFYTHEQASAISGGACPSGWRLPADVEWTALERYLGCTDSSNTLWRCSQLGWKDNTTRNASNNIIQALSIPLSGGRTAGIPQFNSRGYIAGLWSLDISTRVFYSNNNAVYKGVNHPSVAGLNVRCIKN